jgi:hypothetical protein
MKRHIDSFLISPINISAQYFKTDTNSQTFQITLSLTSRISTLRLTISSEIKIPPNQFQIYHKGEILQDEEIILDTKILEDYQINIHLQFNHSQNINFSQSLTKSLFSNINLQKLFSNYRILIFLKLFNNQITIYSKCYQLFNF